MRNIIIHCHIFKNAGTTFDWSLKKNFEDKFFDHRNDLEMLSDRTYLSRFLKKHDQLNAFSSHHINLPLPKINNINFLPVFIFRHPVERAASVYEFERIQNADTPGAKAAKKMSFNEYIKWRMKPSVGRTIRDYQTSYILGKNFQSSNFIGDKDFERAKKILSGVKLLGLVDEYDLSMLLMEDTLENIFDNIDLSYIKQNVNQYADLSLFKKIDNIFSKLESSVIDLFLNNNKYDIQLFYYTRGIIQERLKKINDIDKRLNKFLKRCKKLSADKRLNIFLKRCKKLNAK